ncbi:MAG: helix-turn-helix transcriptional regulator [Pseudomonadota bacterium]|nr:helix-turn-helix transcriptional regulator [Pseudomonadota bacterium]
MNAPTDVRLMEENGVKYAVLPYDDYLALTRLDLAQRTKGIPREIVGDVVIKRINPILAWRRYLGLTQGELASRMDISQPALAQIEGSQRPRKVTLKKAAHALGLQLDQLFF